MPMVLITHRIPCEGMEPLFERYNVCIPPADAVRFDDAQLDELLPQTDVLLACGRISGEQIEKAERLRLICVYGAGYERVDVEAATRRGIPVCTIPDAVTDGTAELALTLLLSVSRRVGELNRRLRQQKPESLFGMGLNTGQSLSGRTLGIVGMGRIGRRMAQMCRALGMHIVYHNRKPLPKPLEQGAQYLPLDELLRVSHAVSIHCPLTEETRGLLGEREINHMRPDAVLINTARGAIVQEDALIAALRSGRIAGAGLDVYPNEPHISPELLALGNAVLTPHIGANTHQTRRAMAQQCAERLLAALEGKPIPGVINGADTAL